MTSAMRPALRADNWSKLGARLWQEYSFPFGAAYILALIVYSYFFTTIIFTNHTLPHAWIIPYPSSRTIYDGRWFSDIILQLAGGSGVQAFQMAIGAAVQIFNAFLLAALLRVTSSFHRFLMAAFLVVHPAFLDYYSFTADTIILTVGDSLALLGVLALDRAPDRRIGIAVGTLCFILTLATYQPKVSLIALLLLVWCIEGARDFLPQTRQSGDALRRIIGRVLSASTAFICALPLYYLSVQLTVVGSAGPRSYMNSFQAVLQQLALAYPEVLRDFTDKVDYLPALLHYLPALAVALGLVALVWRTLRIERTATLATVALVALFPIALRFVYVINDQTWVNSGRILSQEAYCLLFFLAMSWSMPLLRGIATIIIVILVYQYSIIGAQEANSAAMKTIFDLAKLNRIVNRVESVIPESNPPKTPVVVVGALPFIAEGQNGFRPRDGLYQAHVITETFAPYRQVEILNFFLGRSAVGVPTHAQLTSALASAHGRRPWPAPKSVYVDNGVLVILLQRDGPDVPKTWTSD